MINFDSQEYQNIGISKVKGVETIMNKQVGITDTTFRDGQQSLLAARLKTEDMLPIAEKMDQIGFYSMEVWGGATFDTCLRFLNEDPWERLDKIRQVVKKTKLQMLLRGQNIVGYKHFADDVVEEFVKKASAHGIDIFRIFDALNDIRNLRTAVEAAKKENRHVQAAVCYTVSPVHDLGFFLKLARDLVDLGADSICIKDMAGILKPYTAHALVGVLKENIKVPIQIHSHYTSGMASMMYLKAIEAGADVIDTAISSMALGSSQPATETMVAVLANTPFETEIDLSGLEEVADYFKQIRAKYKEFDVNSPGVDPHTILYQVPGGMISNFISQLKQQNALDKLPEVLAEIPRVREDLGYPPLVTPTSQIVGSQAVINTLVGRYEMMTHELRAYLQGQYGAAPGPLNEVLLKKALGDQKPMNGRPADYIKPQLEQARKEMGVLRQKEEDVLSYVMFPQIAAQFFQDRLKVANHNIG